MLDIPKSVTVTTRGETITVKAQSKPATVFLPTILSAVPIVTKIHISKKIQGLALLEYRHYPDGEVQCLLYHGVQHMKVKSINPDEYVTVEDPVIVDFMVQEHNTYITNASESFRDQKSMDIIADAILSTELSAKQES